MEVEEAITFFQIMSEGAEEFGKPMAVLKYYDTALKALHEQAEREKAPQTNFQRHFGTAEEAMNYIFSSCPKSTLTCPKNENGYAMSCKQCWLDWLNAPAEGGK